MPRREGLASLATPRTILPRVPWPAVAARADARLLSLQFQFEQSQWWPEEHLRRHQFMQLEALLDHARRHVPFYASRLDAACGADPLDAAWRRIPVLTRRDVQQAGDALRANQVPQAHEPLGSVTTSGSTGAPITVATTSITALFYHACTLRSHLWHERDFQGTLCTIRVLRPSDPGFQASGAPATDGWTYGFASGRAHLLDVFKSVVEQAAWLRGLRPKYVLTYPSNLEQLLYHFGERGETLPSLHQVCTFGEAVSDHQRRLCRDVFEVPLIDLYSAMEIGGIALQCPSAEHYHVQSEMVYVEILDEAGNPCRPGESGRVVVTNLHNFASPLIRYEIGDLAEVGERCTCGRGLPVIRHIRGRVRDALVMPDGSRRWPGVTIGDLAEIAPIRQMQFVQEAVDRLRLHLVTPRVLDMAEEAAIIARVKHKLGAHFAVQLGYADSIPRAPSGKYHDFICEAEPRVGTGE